MEKTQPRLGNITDRRFSCVSRLTSTSCPNKLRLHADARSVVPGLAPLMSLSQWTAREALLIPPNDDRTWCQNVEEHDDNKSETSVKTGQRRGPFHFSNQTETSIHFNILAIFSTYPHQNCGSSNPLIAVPISRDEDVGPVE